MVQKQIEDYFSQRQDEVVAAVCRLVAIKSVMEPAQPGMPFGPGPAACLDEALVLAGELGLATANHDGYVGTVDLNDKETNLHILGHLDVVTEGTGWTITEPYTPKLVDGMLYGRGTDDDKGPMVAALFAMKAVADLGLPMAHNVRLILGTDEESGSSDIAHYYATHPYAPYTFSPDADFPVINIEKGSFKPTFTQTFPATTATPRVTAITGPFRINVVPSQAQATVLGLAPETATLVMAAVSAATGATFEASATENSMTIIAHGVGGHAAEPEKANNALTALFSLLTALPLANCPSTAALQSLARLFPHGQTDGAAIGIAQCDDLSGALTLAFSMLTLDDEGLTGRFDSRVPLCATTENCAQVALNALSQAGFSAQGGMGKPHHTPGDSPFVKTLLKCYEQYTGATNSTPRAIGGGTYVHNIPGGVAFGSAMPGFVSNLHGPDEHLCVADLMTACKIFTQAIVDLCGQ